jgi:hypothetical protein
MGAQKGRITTEMDEKKKTTVTPEKIVRFLEQTGFVFEMRAHEKLLGLGYQCDIGTYFTDLEGDVEREIDIIAEKVINEVHVHLVIECKQSLLDKWIFIANRKKLSRYYYSVKHLPHVEINFIEDGLFRGLHLFNFKTPLAHNYICYSVETGKKTQHLQIDACVYKLPKAVVDVASHVSNGKHLFFPITLFSGQMFAVSYKGSLLVEERSHLQYQASFKAVDYERTIAPKAAWDPGVSYAETQRSEKKKSIRATHGKLGPHYTLDFVTEAGFPEYVEMLEKGVATINLSNWVVPEPPAKKSESPMIPKIELT